MKVVLFIDLKYLMSKKCIFRIEFIQMLLTFTSFPGSRLILPLPLLVLLLALLVLLVLLALLLRLCLPLAGVGAGLLPPG